MCSFKTEFTNLIYFLHMIQDDRTNSSVLSVLRNYIILFTFNQVYVHIIEFRMIEMKTVSPLHISFTVRNTF
jgi:heme/copper-type cytochrome/quinol oxidase subunit 4